MQKTFLKNVKVSNQRETVQETNTNAKILMDIKFVWIKKRSISHVLFTRQSCVMKTNFIRKNMYLERYGKSLTKLYAF